jgi:L-lactate dehydrogenase complex protein LldF
MTNAFRNHIRTALSNPALQEALDGNSEKRLAARRQVIDSLEGDWDSLRQRAHAVRADVVSHLDEYSSAFIRVVQANGVQVHRAESDSQALEMIDQVIRENEAHLVAKSKSMVSEEIRLNEHLESRGTRVVETDLGEYIIQLRGEHPAHIITPAVHLRRQDVGATFHEKLGIPYTDDIPALVAAARLRLRDVFLEADIGLSGVNFGVVQDGTLCIVTNEGNGRMVTTLPPVHIALMGIERMVPTRQDLALMLSLLPRSATGQKLSVYTTLIRQPIPWSGGNPGQRHLILVDNGRLKVKGSPLAEALYCIRCGACLNACPIFREIGGHAYVNRNGEGSPYPGPIGSVLSPALFGVQGYGHLARASTLCGACKDACPVDIDLPGMLLRVRAGQVSEAPQPQAKPNPPAILALGLRIFAWMAVSPTRFAMAQRMAGFFSRPIAPDSWIKMPAITGWGYSKDFPRPARHPFRDRFNDLLQPSHKQPAITPSVPTQLPPEAYPPPAPQATPLQRFETELTTLGGNFMRCSVSDLPQLLLSFLQENKIDSIMAWKADELPEGVLDMVKSGGIRVIYDMDPGAGAGVTGALAAIAETGSLLLAEGPDTPLTASLLPATHIVLLDSRDIYNTLEHVLALPQAQTAPAAVLISGPSRTADIEMSLTIGVHGPGRLQIFCW